MSEDKLKNIEYRFNQALEDDDKNMTITAIEFYLELNDIDWLISELKKCRTNTQEWKDSCKTAIWHGKKNKIEIKALKDVILELEELK